MEEELLQAQRRGRRRRRLASSILFLNVALLLLLLPPPPLLLLCELRNWGKLEFVCGCVLLVQREAVGEAASSEGGERKPRPQPRSGSWPLAFAILGIGNEQAFHFQGEKTEHLTD